MVVEIADVFRIYAPDSGIAAFDIAGVRLNTVLPIRLPRILDRQIIVEDTELGRPLRENERKTLETLLSVDFPGVAELRAQIPSARVTGSRASGTAPSFDITVPQSAPRSALAQKMAPISAIAFDADREYTGEFILWLADGYLSGLEYAWITGEPPEDLPEPSSIQVSVKK